MTKLLLGHAIVLEALLPPAPAAEKSARDGATPTKPSFGDKGVPKLELGNEGWRDVSNAPGEGAGYRTRTDDLLITNQLLYQLS